MMIILNPTDWPIVVKWNGLDHVFAPDERKPVDDPMGKQVIHNYSQRGLVELIYGDEGEIEMQKAEEGRKRCDAFWTKQCTNYNQDNMRRQETQRPFVQPGDEILFHAQRLGIKMIEPYKLEDANTKQVKLLMEQNADLKKELAKKEEGVTTLQAQVSKLTENFEKLMSLATTKVSETAEAPEAPEGGNGEGKDINVELIKATYTKMSRKNFVKWLSNNWEEIQSYPDDVKNGIAVKHQNLFQLPLPKKQPAIENYNV